MCDKKLLVEGNILEMIYQHRKKKRNFKDQLFNHLTDKCALKNFFLHIFLNNSNIYFNRENSFKVTPISFQNLDCSQVFTLM